jgi:hypothetical protein
MVKNCTIKIMLAQTAHERQNSLIILQLTMIIIDLLTKNRWLSKIIMQRNISRPKETSRKKQTQVIKNQSDEYEIYFNHAMMLTEICIKKINDIFNILDKSTLCETPLKNWVNCCAESFPQLSQNPEKDLKRFVEYCESRIVFEKNWLAHVIEQAKGNGITEDKVKEALEELKLGNVNKVEEANKLLEKLSIEAVEPENTSPINLKIENGGIIEEFPFSIYFDDSRELSPYETGPGEVKFTAEGDYLD